MTLMWNKLDFIKQRPLILKHFSKKGFSKVNVSDFASMIGIPLTVIYEFLAEDMTEHETECYSMIEILNEFYSIGEINENNKTG